MDLFGRVFFVIFSFIINFSFRGLHHQGYECVQCSLVTHKKCHELIPFWCQKSKYPVCIIHSLEDRKQLFV